MSGFRQAALCIHGLSSRDQKWMLKNLSRQQRLTIKGMLRELDAIGIPAERGWLPQIEEKLKNEKLDDSFDSATRENIKTIDHAPLLSIKKLLLVESDEFIAVLLVIRHWLWAEQLLEVFSRQRRSRIEYLLNECKLKPVKMEVILVILKTVAMALKKSNDEQL